MKTIKHGIPQGSIIKTVPRSTVYTYADDTTLIVSAISESSLRKLTQSELNNLIQYFHTNNLVPNASKTVYTSFYPRTPRQPPFPHISSPLARHLASFVGSHTNDTASLFNFLLACSSTKTPRHPCLTAKLLEKHKHAPLLGMTVQNNLKYSHTCTVNRIIGKLWPFIHSIKYANNILPRHTLKGLYFMHAYPHLISNISIWGTADKKKQYIKPLVTLQKKIIRLIFNCPPRTHTAPLMQELKVLNLYNLYTYRVSIEVHRFRHPTPSSNTNRPQHNHVYTPVSQNHPHKTRYAQQQHLYNPSTARIKRNPASSSYINQRNTAVWNNLPATIANIRSLSNFKAILKTYLLAQLQ